MQINGNEIYGQNYFINGSYLAFSSWPMVIKSSILEFQIKVPQQKQAKLKAMLIKKLRGSRGVS